MKLVERILVAMDFNPAAGNVLDMAALVANRYDSEVVLLHVVPSGVESLAEEKTRIEKKINQQMDEGAARLRAAGVNHVVTVVDEGIAAEEINRQANDRSANLIIVGAGSMGPAGQFYLGTTADRLRRATAKPVWIVKPGQAPAIRRILCPVDFSEVSARALGTAVHLARGFQAELTILTVIQSLQSYYEEEQQACDTPQIAAAQTRSVELDRFLRNFDFHGVTWSKVLRGGKPHREIVQLATDEQTDLLVMGSVGRTGVSRLLVGGVARRVAQQPPCSIITVRAESPIRLLIQDPISRMDANFCAARHQNEPCSCLDHGKELLEQGFSHEALEFFRTCIGEYDLCPDAWACLAAAHRRLGHEQEAEECQERADMLAKLLAYGDIEKDVRENHPLFRSIFGV